MLNGCRNHPDCFSCPFPDCIASARKANPEAQRRYRQAHKEKFKEYQRAYLKRKKEKKLNEQSNCAV